MGCDVGLGGPVGLVGLVVIVVSHHTSGGIDVDAHARRNSYLWMPRNRLEGGAF